MDPIICCLLGICCPPASQQQFETLVEALQKAGVDHDKALKAAEKLRDDLADFSRKVEKALKHD